MFIVQCVNSQNALYVKGQGYEGYIFPKEHSIWGFPSENNRYSPSIEDIAHAEEIFQHKIKTEYKKTKQTLCCKAHINKKTLTKYVRQYVGYLKEDGTKIIHIYLNKADVIENKNLTEDVVLVYDGGSNHWHVKVNISTGELFDIQVGGLS